LYINSAIRDKNQETAKGYNDFYHHIEEWRKYGQAMLDKMRMCGVEQDVIGNIILHTPQLTLPKLPQIIPVDEGHQQYWWM